MNMLMRVPFAHRIHHRLARVWVGAIMFQFLDWRILLNTYGSSLLQIALEPFLLQLISIVS